jgi:hypothetical protein
VLRFALSFAAVLLACSPATAQHVSPHAREAVQTIRELRAIGLPDPNDLQNGPPPKVPGLLRQLNRELRGLIVDTLNDQSRRGAPREQEITDQLEAAGWEEIPNVEWNAYGEIVDIDFDWKSGYDPAILIVSTQLWTPCGSSDPESAIYVFQGKTRQWELVIAAGANFDPPGTYEETGIQYELSPPDTSGKWFLAIAHVPPSCRDRVAPANLRYKLLRPGSSPDKPITLLEQPDLIDTRFDPPFRLQVEQDWFALTRGKKRKLDGASAVSISRYEVNGQKVSRIHPLALTPEDFLDEWVQLNWEDAARWASDSGRSGLQNWHSKLSGLEFDSTEFNVVQQCPKQESPITKTWLIDLWIDRQLNPSIKEEDLYVQVSQKNGIFFVDGIYKDRPAGCPGNTPSTVLADLKLPSW